MKAAASRTGKERSYWKRPRQSPWEGDEGRAGRGKLRWEEGCAVLPCWERARGERRLRQDAPLSVAGLAASPARPSREATTSSGWGAMKKGPPKPLPAPGRRRRRRRGEKKRERGGGEFAGVSGGEKTPAVPECPTGLAEGRQRQEPRAGQRHRPPSATR